VLLTTGETFDALEAPATLGQRVLDLARPRAGARGPVAVTAGGRWFFLVRPGHVLRPELERRLDIVRHGRGSWIPAAPSRMVEGAVRWAVPPDQARWIPADAEIVQALLVEAIGSGPERPLRVPRQLSTSRRAA
jgi:hypothetical protein